MTSILELELWSPELVVARISEKGVKDEFPWEIPISPRISGDVELLERMAVMFDINMPQFYFDHEWSKEFEVPCGDLETLVVDGKIYQQENFPRIES